MVNAGNHEGRRDDPVYLRTRREAFMILALWALCFLYSVSYCYFNGYTSHEPLPGAVGGDVAELAGPLESYNRKPDSLTMPLGIPDWVFYGVVIPWGLCVLVSVLFCLFVFVEEDLGPDEDEEEFAAAPAAETNPDEDGAAAP
ncbi:MAG: hypothetical protein AB7K24_13370 [Gemmataceae bacterium]